MILVKQALRECTGTLLLEVMKIAEQIACKAPLVIYGSKRIINYFRDHSTAGSLDYIGI